MDVSPTDLVGHGFLKGMAGEQLAALATCGAGYRSYAEGEFICREGANADEFHLIEHGLVALETTAADRRSLVMVTLEGGEVLGWSWMFPPYRWYFDARAVAATRTLALNGALVRAACQNDPQLGYELTRRIARVVIERLQATRLHALDLYNTHPPRK